MIAASSDTTASITIAVADAAATTVRTTARDTAAASSSDAAAHPLGGSVRDQVALRPEGGLCAVRDPQLREHACEVRLHRLLTDLQLARDQLVGQAARHE